ncbi:MAG: DMT family transporter [Candidatus Neomarinimicrobiota bacterium]|jgi:drug/metabolite transporter (DMT)-like permease
MSAKPARLILYIAFLVNIFIFGSSWIFNKMVLQEGAGPLWATTIRQSIGALTLILILLIKRPKFKLSQRHIILIIIYALFMMALSHLFSFQGQKYIDAGLASIVFSFFPLAVALFSSILMPKKEPFTIKKLIGLLIGLMGIILLFYAQDILGGGKAEILGIMFILFSVLTNAFPNVIIKRDGEDLHPLILNTFGMALAAILLVIFTSIVEGPPDFTFTPTFILAELYLGIICSALGFFLYFWLLQHVSVLKLSLSAYLTPLVAIFLGFIFYNEILTLNHYIGMLLIFMGIFITEFKFRGKHANSDLRR